MKRILLFFVAFFALSSINNLQAQQINEGFEDNLFPPAGWKTIKVSGNNEFVRSSRNKNSGSYSVYQEDEVSYPGVAEHWLITPLVSNIVSGDKVSFYINGDAPDYWYPINSGGQPFFDYLYILISTTGNNPGDFKDTLGTIDLDDDKFAGTSGKPFSHYQFNLPDSVYGKDVYIGFYHKEYQGNGLFIDDITAGTAIANDAMVSNLNLHPDKVYKTGTTVDIAATVYNNGTSSIPAGTPVGYRVNQGTPIFVNTSAAITPGASAVVTFSGSNAYYAATAGTFDIEVFTDWSQDGNIFNDTLLYLINIQEPQGAFPFYEYFEDSDNGWTLTGDFNFRYSDYNAERFEDVIDPNGVKSFGVYANTSSGTVLAGNTYMLRSPLLDFSYVNKPMLNFFVSAQTRIQPNLSEFGDSLNVLISKDGGLTFENAVLTKSNKTSPKLRTKIETGAGITAHFPRKADEWRLEIVDLSAYAGEPNVMVVFKLTSGNGNNFWIDDVAIIDQNPANYVEETVQSANDEVTGPFQTKVSFASVPVQSEVRIQGHTFMNSTYPLPEVNTTATGPDGTIKSPNFVHPKFMTVAYMGNTEDKAEFSVSFDFASMHYSAIPVNKRDSAYIMWRADRNANWKALNTSKTGDILSASGLEMFGDFGIGYFDDAVPVTILSFTGKAAGNAVQLNWRTAEESNILGYDVQRWDGNDWIWIGTVQSNAFSAENHYNFVDNSASAGVNLYRLKVNSGTGSISYTDVVRVTLSGSGNLVYQNAPNPLSNYTIIRYEISKPSRVKIDVFNSMGQQIEVLENAVKTSGAHQVRWNAAGQAPGTYFYKVTIDNETVTKSMLKVK